jgi:hypothetical protein
MKEIDERKEEGLSTGQRIMEWILIILSIATFLTFFMMIVIF